MRASLGATGLALLTALSACGGSSSPHEHPNIDTDAAARPSVSAWTFIDSVGINTHIGYADTGYGRPEVILSLLRQLGVRHVRNGLYADRPDQVPELRRLGRAGMSLDLILGGKTVVATKDVNRSQLAEARQLAPYVGAIEAPNEADCGSDPQWSTDLRTFGTALRATVAGESTLRGARLIGPSFCHIPSISAYGSAAGSYSVANLHVYANGAPPESKLERAAVLASETQGGHLPLDVTETGYHDAPDPGSVDGSASRQVIADYDVRAILDAVRIGVRRVYLYELLDERPSTNYADAEQHFGLANADYSPKPAFDAVAHLMSDVAGGGSPSAVRRSSDPVSFRPGFSSAGRNVRSLVIGDPHGTGGTVAVWLTGKSDDTLPERRSVVEVTLPSTMSAVSRVPSRGNGSSPLGTARRFRIMAGPAPTLVHFAESQ